MEISYSVDAREAYSALRRAKAALLAGDRALGRSAEIIRRDAVREAAKADGTLARNIQRVRIGIGVHEVVSRAPHSRYVEEGTGLYGPKRTPTGHRQPSRQLVTRIAAWVKRKGITPRMGNRQLLGSRQKVNARAELPWLIARKIAMVGTRAQPYMEPAFRKNVPTVRQLVQAAIGRTINQAYA